MRPLFQMSLPSFAAPFYGVDDDGDRYVVLSPATTVRLRNRAACCSTGRQRCAPGDEEQSEMHLHRRKQTPWFWSRPRTGPRGKWGDHGAGGGI